MQSFSARIQASPAMASITVRNLDDALKAKLRLRAAHHQRSMEEEVREILRSALGSDSPQGENLAATIHSRFAPLGGVDLDIPSREPIREPLDLSG
jgi:plasmid stability protein